LISNKNKNGMSYSVHYFVAYDNSKASQIDIQYLVFKLCYIYYNLPGGVKIPAPCYYANKMATSVGGVLSINGNSSHLNDRFSKQLKSLYYL